VLERLAVEKDVAQMQHCRVVGEKWFQMKSSIINK
jgi:hypothetical protein